MSRVAWCNPARVAQDWVSQGYGSYSQPTGGSGGYLLWPAWGKKNGAYHVHIFDNCNYHVKEKGQITVSSQYGSASDIWNSTGWTLSGGARKTRKTRKTRSKPRRSTRSRKH
jgi:hypothetical protein